MLPQLYLKELGSQPIIISLSTSSIWLGLLFGSSFWGSLGDRFRRRRILFILLAGDAVVIGVFALLLPVAVVLPVVLLQAFLVAGVSPIAMSVVSASSSSSSRGRDLSWLSSSKALGLMTGGIIAGLLLGSLGFKWSFITLLFIPVLALLILLRVPDEEVRSKKVRESARSWLATASLRRLYLGTVLRQMGNSGALSLVFVYMANLAISTQSMGAISALNHAVQVIAMLLFGRLADRVGRKAVFIAGFGLSCFVPVIFAISQGGWGMAGGFLTLGIAFSSIYMGSIAHIGDLIPSERQGVMLGMFESSRGLGGFIGPVIAGSIVPLLGFRGMFMAMAGIQAVGFMLVLSSGTAKDR